MGHEDLDTDDDYGSSAPREEHGPFHHTNEAQAGAAADDIDLAGVGQSRLETTVSDPMTENDGTKDAYVSYLVTTDVSYKRISSVCAMLRA